MVWALECLTLLLKLRAAMHKTVDRKIVETIPSVKISHGWMETNGPCSSSSKISTSFFRLFILLNLKQLRTNTIKKLRYLYCWFGVDICATLILTVLFAHCLDNAALYWRHSFFKLTEGTLKSPARSYENSGKHVSPAVSSTLVKVLNSSIENPANYIVRFPYYRSYLN